jgi:glycosyltransferase involved in cell wall biosynthesis
MKVCLVGLDNLPVIAPAYRQFAIGGESVQQTLLARALRGAGHDVVMVTADCGQPDAAAWDGVRVFKAYRADAGIPLLRFLHPRLTRLWHALVRADAGLYYTSCAGMHVAVLALFCKRFGRRFVFRCASDADCNPARLLIRFARDRWLYRAGLRRADAILVQTQAQRVALAENYGLHGHVAGMFIEEPLAAVTRDIDLLWVGNIRGLKRPDLALRLAAELPDASVHLVGGPLAGEEALFHEVRRTAALLPNVTFHGRMAYHEARLMYARARLFLNTSDVEGFPNAFLQAWTSGVPVISFVDPDGVIGRNRLGAAVASVHEMRDVATQLLRTPSALNDASQRCRAFMEREYSRERILAVYLDAFESVTRDGAGADASIASGVRHA